jgi:Histidine kinase-, DNA gyrase B-, and HSP90-like ATPase
VSESTGKRSQVARPDSPNDQATALNVVLRNAIAAIEAPDADLAGSKSAQSSPDFTNCGKAEEPETPVRQGPKRLKRVPFTVSRLMEFCQKDELVNQTGHDWRLWPLVILKELVDNAIDAAEESEVAPIISADISTKRGTIIISDNGPGIPSKTIQSVLDYSVRVSSREAYCSPTRGQQGNALKTVLPMAYVMDIHGEDACGETIIEAHGVAHHITFAVDHIKQEPKITHITKPSTVTKGTRITVTLPKVPYGQSYTIDTLYETEDRFLNLAESFVWLNPHLTLRVKWNGKVRIDIKASNPDWKKWLPSWPTCPHWYDLSGFRRYMSAHISYRKAVTVREFISEFRGMTGSAKQKKVLAETGASYMRLLNFFGPHKANTKNIRKLLASLKRHTKPVRPADLGIIGQEHFYARMEAAGGDPKTFKYNRRFGVKDGLPRVVETAFGIHASGLTAGDAAPERKFITGVNWSPGIGNPFRSIGKSGDGLDALMVSVRASSGAPVIFCMHVACPRVNYLDRGKTAIVVDDDEGGDDGEEE